ncbi:hypothetical protein [Clostridium sp. Marseille-P2415]|uniref:hypothetical protein n=1 Tax=Clostridium sp. Marseille-P2415 TaxID=1805471 RepID=UPI0009882E88|nr:hypothetical protein [Clostridium sp. Marseille-P2415]
MLKLKKIVVVLLSLAMLFSTSISAFAAGTPDTLSPYPPTYSGIVLDGANPPSSGADIHNLSVSSYSYQAKDFGYRIYTSKWLTGSKTMNVTVKDWKLIKEYGGTKDELTIRIFNSSKKEVKSQTITISGDVGSASFSGLSASAKYYVCFEVPTNSNRYSFNGSISQ